jgi:hypothetical protein
MTFEERVTKTLGEMHFANLQLLQRVEQLTQQNGELQTALAKAQAERATSVADPPSEPVSNGGARRVPRIDGQQF